ncbi:hypothetical protein VB780_31100 [Leptolyngbya sp. CCNP1308]|uniref:hypothetical protein n=1 Tax=Leptolyngbya sp. CCNP1308 TaxID=3110255 RepID=UPI002B20EBD6|nr:hypothetical protein [Leptolyngbya sp. CCNP1308]MEA5453060.1 hypothetical protein [Leptolyngbya sp. CCNP1308]
MQTPLHSSVNDASPTPVRDFNVPALIDRLGNFSDAYFDAAWMHLSVDEAEALAALLIHQLTRSLSGRLLTAYLHALRSGESLDLPPIKIRVRYPMRYLPVNFPDEAPLPVFLYGDPVRWTADTLTTGTVIGRYFAYAHHRGCWAWNYLVWLNDPSGQVLADSAWEDDLEAMP